MADHAPRRDAALVALDWGTSSFRGWVLGAGGEVLDEVRTDDGTLRCSVGAGSGFERATAFERAFERLCGPWLDRHPGLPVLAAGMVGSNHGWADAGYLDVPAELARLADHLAQVPVPGRVAGSVVHLVPGLRVAGSDPDVLRGEEVQLVGVLEELRDDAVQGASGRLTTAVLPGTHSKWVRLDGDRVTGFTTVMTGELYGLLLRDSILARLAEPRADDGAATDASDVTAAFDRGVDTDADRGDDRGLASLLFTARTLVMAGTLRPDEVADYVSGLLVGSEVRHALRSADGPGGGPGRVVVCASRSTGPRYHRALTRHGAAAHGVGEDVAARGLWRVARDAGLVAATPDTPETPETPETPDAATPHRTEERSS
ncbi:2-dehydro-3-deoxygalactonokinase [Isoptericola sp. NPDC019693]|uniref:2-dehydro-3-deoxygalactonokinase n=1 Tax=Isoptericola sp. NPDC019693 TaxID=3364009 RepID=UPI00378E3190